MEERLRHFAVLSQCCLLVLLLTAFYLQVVRSAYYKDLSSANRIRIIPLPAPRGTILDRNGVVLAGNRVAFSVVALPQELPDADAVFARLSPYVDIEPDELKRRYTKNYYVPFAPAVLMDDIKKEKALYLEEVLSEMPGIAIRPSFVREYPLGTVGAHMVGYVGEITAAELDRLKEYGYRMKDVVGRQGIEEQYDSYMRGVAGGKQIEADNRGRQVRVLGSRLPRAGKDVRLTVDSALQAYIRGLLQGYTGAVVVLDAQTGAVLAMESTPGFDPNVFVRRDEGAIRTLQRSSVAPFLNRALSGRYPPGSIFKLVVACAALEKGGVQKNQLYECQGYVYVGDARIRCWRREGHGFVNVTEALIGSCNVYFIQAGLKVGPVLLEKYARLFGFGSATGIELGHEYDGLVPNKLWKRQHMHAGWYDGDTANMAIGQGYIIVTPLQVARMTAAIANGGRLLRPYLVEQIGGLGVARVAATDTDVSQGTLRIIRDAMTGVIREARGTGHTASTKEVAIAAKTGTAQTAMPAKTHAWFTGFAPAEKPRIAFVILIEYGGSGGDTPALIARQLVLYAKEQGLL
ncbi:MAG: penicillin-binding protein 2 [Candidatus Omnitrophica bacterium]|nr:penicillin-binding protein 2 [Candidatus Omnitrophota bacterium]